MTEMIRAAWDTAYINNLPDSAFLYVESGGSKDSEGKTTPRTLRHFPYRDSSGAVDLPHLRNALSRIPQSSLPSDVKSRLTTKAQRLLADENRSEDVPPRDLLVRTAPAFELVRSTGENGMPILHGRGAVFDEWTEIRSLVEGHFFERFSKGAFAKTIADQGDRIRCLFSHGSDPSIGMKPLGPIIDLAERDDGVHYEVQLLDTDYNRSLIPGLEAGLYGSSFRFGIIRKSDERNRRSERNPGGILERTVTEAYMRELGPTPFPAYDGTTASVRSLTDEYVLGRFPTEQLLAEAATRTEDRDLLSEMRSLADAFVASEDTDRESMLAIIEMLERMSSGDGDEESPDAPSSDAALVGTSRRSAATTSTPLWGQDQEEAPSWRL